MPAVGSLWRRFRARLRGEAIEREVEKEQMSEAERRIASEPIEDLQTDRFVGEHLGGDIDPERREE